MEDGQEPMRGGRIFAPRLRGEGSIFRSAGRKRREKEERKEEPFRAERAEGRTAQSGKGGRKKSEKQK